MSDSRSVPSADGLDDLGDRAVAHVRAVAERSVGGLPDASRIVDRGRRRRATRLVAVMSAVAIILVGAALVQSRARTGADLVDVAATDAQPTGTATDVDPAPGQESPSTGATSTLPTLEEVLGPVYASGWLPYDGEDVLHPEPGGLARLKGYARHGENITFGKAPIYDAPDGVVVGYAYSQLGFVSVVDDPTFDAHAERVARFGCDAFQDPACKPAGMDVP